MVKNEEDYGFGSSDEDELLALVDAPQPNLKRKGSNDDLRPSKRPTIGIQAYPAAVAALQKTFGFEKFQLKQEQVISTLLSGKSAAVVFPTGGGKSLCFQIPALVFSEVDKIEEKRGENESGVTLVVSPLIALMKDQVDALVRRGIKAATMDSTKTREQYLETCEMLRNGVLKLLYCAPERLNNEGFVEQMKHVRGGIRLLAVDEAHCISEWGHAFRPDYLKVARFVKEIRAERVVCLTATATPRVAKDICDAFEIEESGLFRTSTYRPNLQLLAESGKTKDELLPRLYQFLRNNPGPTIVYVTLQNHTDALALKLKTHGFKARAFHAGMDPKTKTALQDEFLQSKNLIMVATIAFGMGIDKSDIRNVIHFNIPSSLESYSQEIGRAGRDGKVSKCMFYICGEDLHLREMFARGDLPSKAAIRGLLRDIFVLSSGHVPVGQEIKTSHYQQAKDYDIRNTTLSNVYAQLELTHGLIRATTPVYTKYGYKASPQYKTHMQSDNSPAGKAVKLYGNLAKTMYSIDVDSVALTQGIPRADIIRKLADLNDAGIIDLKPSGVYNVYKVIKPLPTADIDIEKLVTGLYSIMEEREQQALARTNDMLNLITGESCFSKELAKHFGDTLADNKSECGHCTWCLTHKAVVQELPPKAPFNYAKFNMILKAVPVRDDPHLLAKIAFGIASPRITTLKMSNNSLFGSMEDHEFADLLREFTLVCDGTNKQ